MWLKNVSTLDYTLFYNFILLVKFLQTIVYVCSVGKLCLTLCDPVDCSLPGSARLSMEFSRQEWLAIPFSRRSSQFRDQIWVSCNTGRFFTV